MYSIIIKIGSDIVILRKPYAFLIKHFKKIHILLLLIMLYGVYKTNNLSNFFSNYARNTSGFYESTLASTYINSLFFMGCISIIIISTVVLILMKQKDKPTKLYVFIIVGYILMLVLLFLDGGYLRTIIFEQLSPRTTRMLRDINYIALIPQIVLSFLVLIRAIGFNIKRFNFSQDIEDLKIDVSDSEEFELTIGTDTGKINRLIRRNKRELKYFYLENKALIISIIVLIVIFVSSSAYYNKFVLNKIYNQKDVVRVHNISYKVENFYSSNINYRGEDISEKDHTFLILSLKTYNGNENSKKIEIDNLRIVIGENIYLPIVKQYDSFRDLGIGYNNQKLESGKEATYIFVYKVSNEDLEKPMILRYNDNVFFTKEGIGSRYIKIKVKPTDIKEISTLPRADLKKEVYYGLSNLKETRLTINDVEFKDKYSYELGNLIYYINDPMDNRLIMKINYKYDPDKGVEFIGTLSELLKEYGTIRYEKDNKQVVLLYKDVTPRNYKDDNIYLSVPSNIKDSKSIDLIINVRDKVYIHKLK